MARPPKRITTTVAIAVTLGMAATVSGCSRSYDTTQVDAVGQGQTRRAASTTSIVTETVPPSTTMALEPMASYPDLSSVDVQGTLSQLVAGFAADPTLVSAVDALGSNDLVSVAKLFGIDLDALAALGLSARDISALGASAGALAGRGSTLDPAALIGVLVSSLNVGGIANSAINRLIGALLQVLSGAQLVISPDVTVYLSDMLGDLDLKGLGDIIVTPENTPLIALITSVVLANNPILFQGIIENANLDPSLAALLKSLTDLNSQLGQQSAATLLQALRKIFPNLPI